MTAVSDILARKGSEVVAVPADESVLNAARLMNERGIGGVVVTSEGRLAGIFTERDILRRVVAEQRDPAETLVRDVMTTPVIRCKAQAKLDDVMAIMSDKRIRHLPVMDGDRIAGIVTSGDLMAHQVAQQQETIDFLNSYVFDLR